MRGIRLGCHRCPFRGIRLAEHLDHAVQPLLHASVTRGRCPQLDALLRAAARPGIQTSVTVIFSVCSSYCSCRARRPGSMQRVIPAVSV